MGRSNSIRCSLCLHPVWILYPFTLYAPPVTNGRSRGGAWEDPAPTLFWVKKEMTEGRKASRVIKSPPSPGQGLDPPLTTLSNVLTNYSWKMFPVKWLVLTSIAQCNVNFKLIRFYKIYGFHHSYRLLLNIIFLYWIWFPIEVIATIIILVSLTAWLLACEDADRPVHKRTTLSFASFSSPHVSYATSSSGITPSLYLKWNGWSCKNVLKPEFTLEYIGSRPKTLDLMI